MASSSAIHFDVLVVGAGPAGASAAAFLVQNGALCPSDRSKDRPSRAAPGITKVLVVNKAGSTADTPRAHITNAAALECMRDLGLEEACLAIATPKDKMLSTRFVDTFLGEEYARLHSWGNVLYLSRCSSQKLTSGRTRSTLATTLALHLAATSIYLKHYSNRSSSPTRQREAQQAVSTLSSSPSSRMPKASPLTSVISSPARSTTYAANISSAQTVVVRKLSKLWASRSTSHRRVLRVQMSTLRPTCPLGCHLVSPTSPTSISLVTLRRHGARLASFARSRCVSPLPTKMGADSADLV